MTSLSECPICNKSIQSSEIEQHVNECIDTNQSNFIDVDQLSPSPPSPIFISEKQPVIDLTRENEDEEVARRLYEEFLKEEEASLILARRLKEEMEREEEFQRKQVLELLVAEERKRKEEEELTRKLVQQLQENDEKEFRKEAHNIAQNETYQCTACSKFYSLQEMHYLDDCSHMFCKKCLHSFILTKMGEKNCAGICCSQCKKIFSPRDFKELLSSSEYEQYEIQSVQEMIDKNETFTRCPNSQCNNAIERISGNIAKKQKELGPDGNPLSDEAVSHRNDYRFRCHECSTEFCAKCKTIPYHLGYTCEKFLNYKQAKHCRFCTQQLTPSNTAQSSDGINDVCTSDECVTKRELSCSKILGCRHPCHGVKNERNCLKCLHEDCANGSNQTGSDLCNICYIDGLENAPCIQLDCGHIFHYMCAKNKITSGWAGARITFSFLDCALCKQRMSHPLLATDLKPWLELYDAVLKKAMQRLQVMGHDKGPEINDPKSRYYKKPENYSVDRYSYYTCFKCKKPYFGGERACDAQNRLDNFNEQELICGGCSSSGKDKCPTHDVEFIEYKCKFCCSVAQWFCWGNTHFCEACHVKAATIVHVPRDQLPKCTCSIKHPPNGEEFCLGCSMCILSGGSDF